MSRPKTKKELLALSQTNYGNLIYFIESFIETTHIKEFPEAYLNPNKTDVLAHLRHWHLMVLHWHEVGIEGGKPDMPAKGYIWKTVPYLNHSIWKKYKDATYSDVKKLLDTSYNDIHKVIEKHTDQELFEKKKYKWTGTTSLGAYLISATSSHYHWAHKLIKKATKVKLLNCDQECDFIIRTISFFCKTPDWRQSCLPFLNKSMVGTPRTWYFEAIDRFLSTSIFTILMASPISSLTCFRIGANILQGPHQSA